MSDDMFDAPENDNLENAFSAMEESLPAMPESARLITIRHEANAPVYVELLDGEETITIRAACERHQLTLGAQVTAYVDSTQVALDTLVAAGTVVMLVGTVKGG